MLSVASATSPFHWSFTFTILGHPCTLPRGIFVGNPLQRPGFQLFQSSTNWQSGPVDYLIVRIPEPIGSQAFKRLNLLSEHSKSVIFWCSHSGIGSAPRFNRLKFPNSNPTQKPWFSGESFWFYGLQGEGIWNDLSVRSNSKNLQTAKRHCPQASVLPDNHAGEAQIRLATEAPQTAQFLLCHCFFHIQWTFQSKLIILLEMKSVPNSSSILQDRATLRGAALDASDGTSVSDESLRVAATGPW